ncbi:MAG: murein L,D-transpeptidase catalytic domain family protein [Flavobacteriales bacterium]
MQQDQSLAYPIFKQGVRKMLTQNSITCKDKLIIADYSQPSTQKRFYFFDLKEGKLLLQTYVAHGRNSGELYALHFSNIYGSFQTSLGLYHTAEVYCGAHDLSVRLDGLEPHKNSNIRKRDIVIHRAAYANESFILENGKLGRSFGCLALPEEVSDEMLEQMAGGVGVYVYGNSH